MPPCVYAAPSRPRSQKGGEGRRKGPNEQIPQLYVPRRGRRGQAKKVLSPLPFPFHRDLKTERRRPESGAEEEEDENEEIGGKNQREKRKKERKKRSRPAQKSFPFKSSRLFLPTSAASRSLPSKPFRETGRKRIVSFSFNLTDWMSMGSRTNFLRGYGKRRRKRRRRRNCN